MSKSPPRKPVKYAELLNQVTELPRTQGHIGNEKLAPIHAALTTALNSLLLERVPGLDMGAEDLNRVENLARVYLDEVKIAKGAESARQGAREDISAISAILTKELGRASNSR